MPIINATIHLIDKKPDGTPAVLTKRTTGLPMSQATDNLLADLNDTYNAKASKVWGFFSPESGAYPFSGWLKSYTDKTTTFDEFAANAAEHLVRLLEESNLSTGGHFLVVHYQQGMTDYLLVGLVHQSDGINITQQLDITPARYIDTSQLHVAARVNMSEWRNNANSKQYISFIAGKNGRKVSDYFRDFIGCQQSIDAPSETRTLLKAFSDFVESEDMPESEAREKTNLLVDYAASQSKLGDKITLDELSQLLDEDQPKAFSNFISAKDYGLSPEIPADKRTMKQFQRFTGRAEGLSISFDSSLLGSKVEFDEAKGHLIIRELPTLLKEQLRGKKGS